MSQTRITVTEEHATTRLTISPIGLQGAPGPAGTSSILEVTDSVANAAALPAAADHENEFWLAEDTGVIWYSNGTTWIEASIGSGVVGTGDLSDGDTLTTGLTFPIAGLHLLDTNASHDLILSPGSDLTADRTLTLTTGDANRTLTLTADASVGGTNTGDQDLSGYVAKATFDANTILAATADNTPAALTVAEQTLVGRVTGGEIDDLSATQVRTLLNVADGATAAGAIGDAFASSHPGGNQHIDWTSDQGATDIHAGNIPDLSGTYATAAKGVTNGDSHDHNGGDGGPIAYSTLSGLPTLGTAAAAATTDFAAASHAHGNITNAGAIGSTESLPIITTTSGVLTVGAFGTGATNFTAGNDARLSDARTPTAHASTHSAGGADALKLDDLAAPDDNTDLDASTTKHGLLLKATAPASGLLSVVGIGNTETAYTNKALFDTTNPAALGTAGPGTQIIAARRDHIHALPAIDATAAATDITTRNVTTSVHGLAPKAVAPAAGLINFLGIANGETTFANKALFDTTNPASLGTVGPGTAVIAARRDHVHANPAIDTLAAATDITTLNATTTAHGLSPKAVAPAAGLINVLGIGNTETAYTNKALFDTTNPADLGTAAPGTSLIAARRDHVHNAPAGSAADIDQYDVAARLAAGAGAYTGVATADLTEETTPAAGDFLLGWESGGALRKFDVGDLPAGIVADGSITLAKMANLAQDQFIGRVTASTGVPETATITAAARTVLDDTTVAAMVNTLGGTASTGSDGLVRATSPTLVTPVLGTPASGTLTNCTGLPISAIDLDGGTDIGADLADADLILVDDGASGTNRKSVVSRIWTYIIGKLFANTPAANEFARFTDGDTLEGRTKAEAQADLSIIGYQVSGYSNNLASPADATGYAFGMYSDVPGAGSVAIANRAIPIYVSGTITAATVRGVAGTAGSNESWVWSIRVNDTTNYDIATVSSTNTTRDWINTSLSIPITAGDTIVFYSTTPTWGTNPSNLRLSGHAYIKPLST